MKKAIAQSKVVTKTKGLVLDGLSSKSDTILSLNKRIGESVQNVFEKINLPTQNKLAFSSASGGGRSGIEAIFDYVDESVMKNFNKVTSSETLQSTVKHIDNNISSSIKTRGRLKLPEVLRNQLIGKLLNLKVKVSRSIILLVIKII